MGEFFSVAGISRCARARCARGRQGNRLAGQPSGASCVHILDPGRTPLMVAAAVVGGGGAGGGLGGLGGVGGESELSEC